MSIIRRVPPRKATIRAAALGGVLILAMVAWSAALPPSAAAQATLLSASFDTDSAGFVYADDAFGTFQPIYTSGAWVATAGFAGTGGLQVTMGGVDATLISDMSGGWSMAFSLPAAETGVALSFRYKLDQSATYEYDEYTRMLVSVDGVPYGRGSKAYVDHIGGDGVSALGNSSIFLPTTDWQQHQIFVGDLAAGTHTIVLGGYNNKKDAADESSTVTIDDVLVTSGNAAPAVSDRQAIVNRLTYAQFVNHLDGLTGFGDRCRMSSCPGSPANSFFNAQGWVASSLIAMGYTVEYHTSTLNGGVSNLYATKVGTVNPDQMYIVSAHLDGRGGGAAYDDDGSGSALVLSAAEVFAGADVQTDKSVRFIWWDREEAGLLGSSAYVQERRPLQGTVGEPTWLGIIQHDMILFDHGAGTASALQSPYADLDVEWRAGTAAESLSRVLALKWRFLNGTYSTQYPSTAYDFSTNTDDTPFQPYVASISVRENRRNLTSGSNAEWINPNYHTATDVASSYSALDLNHGFNAVQGTVGMVAELVNAHLAAPPRATTTAVGSSVNPSAYGQAVTFTAIVAVNPPDAVPTGIVTFKDGAASLGTGTLNGAGQATLTTSSLSAAVHIISAVYGGSAGFNASTSAALTQTVDQAATVTAVTSSPNPSVTGQLVTFSAIITANAPGSGVPAGTVTFTEGATVLASGVVVDGTGRAAFNTATLGAGSHVITADFTGTSNWMNSSGSASPQVVNAAPIQVTFTSVAAQDGWVLESSETSNAGGSIAAAANNTSALRVGDNSKNRQYKTIVSFATASIPDGATIISVTLRLRRGTVSGTNPFTTHGASWVDVEPGSGFSGSTTLQTGDFQAAATAVKAASLGNAANNGDWSEGSLNAAGLAAINKAGTTQLRVYFTLDDNNDGGNDYIGYYSGDNATAANRPQLVVKYQ